MLIEKAHSNYAELILIESRTLHWYAIYVQCHHEARVESVLQRKGIEVFLPRVATLSRRRDRRLLVNAPLFPGYLFIRTDLESYDYREILRAPGTVQLLGSKGNPSPVPKETIDSVRAIVDSGQPFYPWPYLETGSLVRVLDGPLAGVVGVIQGRNEKKRRLIIAVELFQRSVAVKLDSEAVERWS